jgi:hypothetical protein
MIIRFIIYGMFGWCGEIIWTTTREKLSDQHGVTSHLTEQELQDSVAFMLALPIAE